MKRYCSVLLLLSTIFFACTSDSADKPDAVECTEDISFKTDVLPVIERTCSYQSSCHATGSANGDFLTYESLKVDIDNEKFASRVLQKKDMPPQYAPDDKPKSLDDAEINIIQCWADAGYPNN